jgi:Tripartite tricarboxylate transporter TctB family
VQRQYMNNLNFVRGLFLLAIALLFGLAATRYQVGAFARSGPGLFPLIVSSMLGILGLVTMVQSRYLDPVPLNVNVKNICIILLSLCGVVLISKFVNMTAGIVFLVFFASLAGNTPYSVVRNLKITAGLLIIALIFKNLLGLNLPLI